MPDGPERQDQDQDVGYDVDGSCDDEIEIRVETCTWGRCYPRLVYGVALEDDRQHVGGIEADVHPDEALDEPIHEAALSRYENSHELEQDCEFRSQDCRRVAGSIDVKQLGCPLAFPIYRIGFSPITTALLAYLQHRGDIQLGYVPLMPSEALVNLEDGQHAGRYQSHLLPQSARWVPNRRQVYLPMKQRRRLVMSVYTLTAS